MKILIETKQTDQNKEKLEMDNKDVSGSNEIKEKRARTESIDSGNGRLESSENFLDNKEFAIALEIVMNCEYLAAGDKKTVTEADMISQIVEHIEDDEEHNSIILIEFLIDKLDIIKQRKPNIKQFKAFLDDIKYLHNESSKVFNIRQGVAFDIPLNLII